MTAPSNAELLRRIVNLEAKIGLIPAKGEKHALVGSYGVPSSLNPYITKNDEKLRFIKVGGIYINVTGVNPASELGYGTWTAFGTGKTLVGVDEGDPDFHPAEHTCGAKTAAVPAHTHPMDHVHPAGSVVQSGSGVQVNDGEYAGATGSGGSGEISVVQPSIAVYFWKRIA